MPVAYRLIRQMGLFINELLECSHTHTYTHREKEIRVRRVCQRKTPSGSQKNVSKVVLEREKINGQIINR